MRRPLQPFQRSCAALALLLGVACGESSSPPAVATVELAPVEACRLILPREADAAAGMRLDTVSTPLDRSTDAKSAKCSFGVFLDDQMRLLSLEVRQYATQKDLEKEHGKAREMLPRLAGSPLEVVPNLGDEAFWAGGTLSQLHVWAGNRRLIVSIEMGEESRRLGEAVKIASNALARLSGQAPAASAPGRFDLQVTEPEDETSGSEP